MRAEAPPLPPLRRPPRLRSVASGPETLSCNFAASASGNGPHDFGRSLSGFEHVPARQVDRRNFVVGAGLHLKALFATGGPGR